MDSVDAPVINTHEEGLALVQPEQCVSGGAAFLLQRLVISNVKEEWKQYGKAMEG
jgi:hypothetical protein